MGMKPCPVPPCDRRCSDEYLMCRYDWARVSPRTRDEVYAAFGALDFSVKETRDAYRSARDEAIRQAVESRARQAERQANR